jgi:hypothetical protein
MNKKFIMQRFTEPSTWAGVAVLFQVAAAFFPAHAAVINVLSGAAACVAGVKPEGAPNVYGAN